MRYALFGLFFVFTTGTALAADTFEDWEKAGDADTAEEKRDESKAGQAAFDKLDLDNDGFITESEFETGIFGKVVGADSDKGEEQLDSAGVAQD